MAEIVPVDKAGRLVIPKSIREALGITEGSNFIVVEGGNGRLLFQKIDIEEITKNLKKEMKGKNVNAIVKKIRKEMNEKVKKRYPHIFS